MKLLNLQRGFTLLFLCPLSIVGFAFTTPKVNDEPIAIRKKVTAEKVVYTIKLKTENGMRMTTDHFARMERTANVTIQFTSNTKGSLITVSPVNLTSEQENALLTGVITVNGYNAYELK